MAEFKPLPPFGEQHKAVNNHPITPPQNLIYKWRTEGYHQDYCGADDYLYHKIAQWGWEQRGAANEAEQLKIRDEVADKAAQWGWDQRGADIEAKLQKARDEELKACIEWLEDNLYYLWGHFASDKIINDLKEAMRPQEEL